MNRIDLVLAALLTTTLGGNTAAQPAVIEEPEPAVTPFIGPPRLHERVVIITIDGVRWQEIFGGVEHDRARGLTPRTAEELTPNLHRLIATDGAALGAPGRGTISASGPNYVSLPGYREILTGKPSVCQTNDCTDPAPQTILDEAYDAGLEVAAFGSWDRLDRAVRGTRYMTSFGRHGDPALGPGVGDGDFRKDRFTAAAALEHLETHRPDVMYIGLGEPDEYAHNGDYPGYVGSIQAADAVVGQVWAKLQSFGDRGAHLFVTADHGRDRAFRHHGGYDPQSSRVWLFAVGPRVKARGYALTAGTAGAADTADTAGTAGTAGAAGERHLRDIAPTVRMLLELSPRRGGTSLNELFE